MSKTKEQYFDDGVMSAIAGEPAPIVAANASWQVKAFAAGYNSLVEAEAAPAKTREYYIELGRSDFESHKERIKFDARCWQEDAYDEGYNAALRAYAVRTNGAPLPPVAPVVKPAKRRLMSAHYDPNQGRITDYAARLLKERHKLRVQHGYILVNTTKGTYKPPANVRPQVAKQVRKLSKLLKMAGVS